MRQNLYLRPIGILWGQAASQALAERSALALAGGPAAFLAAQLIEGEPGKSAATIMSAAQLTGISSPAVKELLERITRPRPAIAGLSLDRPRVMGILNVTPDSFSDGGLYAQAGDAAAHARAMAAQGADIIDIGGESTRPRAEEVPLEEERRRILPALKMLKSLGAPVSIDTRKAAIMREAAKAGAAILNDISALSHNAGSMETAAALRLPVVLMHAQGDPKTMQENPIYEDVLLEVYDYLDSRIEAAAAAGIAREMLIADPGIGFGKTLAHNLALLEGLSLLHGLGTPVLLGASRKGFIGALSGAAEPSERAPGSIAAALVGLAQGVQIVRVHDVAATRQAIDVWHPVMSSGNPAWFRERRGPAG